MNGSYSSKTTRDVCLLALDSFSPERVVPGLILQVDRTARSGRDIPSGVNLPHRQPGGQALPPASSPPLVTVSVAEQAASPAVLAALQVYRPACSQKASTTMSVATLVTSSKWNTRFLVGRTGCRSWNQLISGLGVPDTRAWKRATSPCATVQLVRGWVKAGLRPPGGFLRLAAETRLRGSAGLVPAGLAPERKQVHGFT